MPPTCAFTSEAIAFEFAPLTMLSALRRYPYMACEVICCDIGEIIDTLETHSGLLEKIGVNLLVLEIDLAALDPCGKQLQQLR